MNDSIEALGWTLVHFCWQAAAIALLYRLLDVTFSRSRSHVRYAISLASMAMMLVAAVVTLGYESQRIFQESTIRIQAAAAGLPVPDCASPGAGAMTAGGVMTRLNSSSQFPDLLTRIASADLMPWIDALWLVGVLALSIRMLGGWMMIRRLQRSTRTNAPASLYATFVQLAVRMGVQRKVDLLICSRISGPVAMGVLRSAVLLPISALTHLSPEQLEVVLAHELAHIRRGDYLWNMMQSMLETLFFFHPAVWWLGGRTRQLRELCCDDAAVECCGDPVVYATALLQLEEQRNTRLRLAMALDGNGGAHSLKTRIVRILDGVQGDRASRREIIPFTLVGVVALIFMFFVPLPRVAAGHAAVVDERSPIDQKTGAAPAQKKTEEPEQSAPVSQTKQDPTASQDPTAPVEPIAAPVVESAVPALPVPPVAPVPTPEPVVIVAPAPVPAITVHPKVQIAMDHVIYTAPAFALRSPINISRMKTTINPSVSVADYTMLQGSEGQSAKENYVKQMGELGYTDLDKLIAMKVQGITPEYARSMQNTGYGKLSADDLVSLKIFGVTPEMVEQMKAAGVAPKTIHELVSYRIFKVTPEYAASWKEAGFGSLSSEKLLQLRVQNITPEYARSIRQQYPNVTVDQLIQMKIFRIDDKFIALAKSHGFDSPSIDKLIRLRITAVLDDNSVQR